MTRKTVVIPMHRKKKLGSNAERSRGRYLTSIEATQFALEQAVKRIVALEKQCDGLAKLDKEKDIRTNLQGLELKRLRERVERMDGE
jgi:hypothetical protein